MTRGSGPHTSAAPTGNDGTQEDQEEATDTGEPARPLHRSPGSLALVAGVFLLIIGVPAGLAYQRGYTTTGTWILAGFAAMVVVTAYTLRVMVQESGGDR